MKFDISYIIDALPRLFEGALITLQVAILGFSKMENKIIPVADGKFKKRLILPFSLTYDHRVIDGADAARFTTKFGEYISTIKNKT